MEINGAKKFSRRSIAAALLAMEAAVVLSLGVFLLIKSATSPVVAVGAVIGVSLFSLLGGIGLLGAAQGFRTGKNYGRAPAVLANLISLGVAYYQMGAHLWFSAIPLAALSIATLIVVIPIVPTRPTI